MDVVLGDVDSKDIGNEDKPRVSRVIQAEWWRA